MREWIVIYRPRFSAWLAQCTMALQTEVLAHVEVLSRMGPSLGRPRVDHIKTSTHPNMKELRVQFKGDPVRILFAFDPARRAVLILGGIKTGDKQWYRRNIPVADREFSDHLRAMQMEQRSTHRKEDSR